MGGVWHKWALAWSMRCYEKARFRLHSSHSQIDGGFTSAPLHVCKKPPVSLWRLRACRFHEAENCWSWSCSDIWDCSALPCLLGQLWLTNTQILRAERWFNYRIRREEVIRVVLNPGECTSVTAGAVVRSLVGTLLAGVVTEMALPPHRVTPLLTADFAASVIKEPAGEDVVHYDHAKSVALFLGRDTRLKKFSVESAFSSSFLTTCGFCWIVVHQMFHVISVTLRGLNADVCVSYRVAGQLVQSSLSGPVHCWQVTSHRWHFLWPMYSPADGEQQ